MDWWDDELCEQIAARSHQVVRYDQRDAGRSTNDLPGAWVSSIMIGSRPSR